MAVDIQEKRMSATGAGRPWMRSKLPGSNDQAWRIASGNGYAGNAIAEPPVTLPTTIRRTTVTEATLPRTARSAEGTVARGGVSEDMLRRT